MVLNEFKTQQITWDKATKQFYEKVEANSGDTNGRKLNVQIINNSLVENLTGVKLNLAWRTKNNKNYGLDAFKVIDATKGIFEIYYTTEMLSNVGKLKASLVMIDSVGRTESDEFDIDVKPSVVNDGAVQSENSFTALTEALVSVTDLEENYAPRLNEVTELVKTKANVNDVFLKNQGININDFDEPTRKTFLEGQNVDVNYVLGEGNVGLKNLSFYKESTNLLNKTTNTDGYLVNTTNGQLSVNAPFDASDFISVEGASKYIARRINQLAFYDSNKVFISGVSGPTTTVFTTPANASYIRYSWSDTDNIKNQQLNKGETLLPYEDYYLLISNDVVEKKPLLTSDITNEAITEDKTSFLYRGKNLFNKDTVKEGFINSVNGDVNANYAPPATYYMHSDYISITGGSSYVRNRNQGPGGFYDSNKRFIQDSGFVSGGLGPYNAPDNAAYLRISVAIDSVDYLQVEEGIVQTPYESFSYKINNITFEDKSLDAIEKIVAGSPVEPSSVVGYIPSKNLFDKSVTTPGVYINPNAGTLSVNEIYSVSDFMIVDELETYSFDEGNTGARTYAEYDANKSFLRGGSFLKSPLTTGADTAFVRMTIEPKQFDSYQFEKGTILTPYVSFAFSIKNLKADSTNGNTSKNQDEILAFLPKELNIAVGRTIELYNKQAIWTGNLDNYHVQWVCSVGRSLDRKWSCKAELGMIGSYNLKMNVYDNNRNQVAVASTVVNIVSNIIENPVVLGNWGDSLSNAKPWYAELKSLSANKISYGGTRTGGMASGEGHEGRSGASAKWYLENSTYTFESNYDQSNPNDTTGKGNPFWNPTTGKFDYDYYRTAYNKNLDAIQLYLGTNGMALNPDENVKNIKAIVDGIREADANIPIFVVNTLYRGGQDGMGKQLSSDGYSAGSGVWKLEEDRKVFNLMVALSDALKDYSNVHFVPIALTHDSENNFKDTTKQIAVNPRSTITKIEDSEATHPQTPGYLQMADIMFSTIAAKLS